ncbi:hypothetical protein B0T13DRAFT_463154 [Neurospora crassa]|nr:hypothetical protein B0T13DRAFT_463154 [Neurospora crassa]
MPATTFLPLASVFIVLLFKHHKRFRRRACPIFQGPYHRGRLPLTIRKLALGETTYPLELCRPRCPRLADKVTAIPPTKMRRRPTNAAADVFHFCFSHTAGICCPGGMSWRGQKCEMDDTTWEALLGPSPSLISVLRWTTWMALRPGNPCIKLHPRTLTSSLGL